MLIKSHMKLTKEDTKQGNKVWHIFYMVEQNHYFAYFRNQEKYCLVHGKQKQPRWYYFACIWWAREKKYILVGYCKR